MPDKPSEEQHPPHGFNLIAGLLACVLPGLGHVYRGELRRGVIACVGVVGLFFSGLLIGGIDVIDAREDKLWFVGQALVGPIAFITNSVHQSSFKAMGDVAATPGVNPVLRSGNPNEHRVVVDGVARWEALTSEQIASGMGPPNRKSLGRVNELGTLFATLAGMMNLIVFLDALFPTIRPKGHAASAAVQGATKPSAAATSAPAAMEGEPA